MYFVSGDRRGRLRRVRGLGLAEPRLDRAILIKTSTRGPRRARATLGPPPLPVVVAAHLRRTRRQYGCSLIIIHENEWEAKGVSHALMLAWCWHPHIPDSGVTVTEPFAECVAPVWNYPTRSRDGASSSDDNPDYPDRDRGATPPRTTADSPCTQSRRPFCDSAHVDAYAHGFPI